MLQRSHFVEHQLLWPVIQPSGEINRKTQSQRDELPLLPKYHYFYVTLNSSLHNSNNNTDKDLSKRPFFFFS